MVMVPRYRSQANVGALPDARINVRDVASGVKARGIGQTMQAQSQALRSIGQAAGAVVGAAEKEAKSAYAEWRQKQDAAAKHAAYHDLGQMEQSLLHDPDGGFFQKHQRDALEAADPTLNKWREAARKLKESVPEHLREEVQHRIDMRELSVQGSISKHVSRESEALARDTYNARMTNLRDRLEFSVDVGNLEQIDEILAEGEEMIEDMGVTGGWGDEQIEEANTKFLTSAHLSVIDRLRRTSPVAARQYFDRVRWEMNEEIIRTSKVEEALSGSMAAHEAMGTADKIWEKHTDGGDTNFKMALADAYEIADPLMRDEVVKRVVDRLRRTHLAQSRTDDAILGRMKQELLDHPFSFRPETHPEWVNLRDAGRAQIKQQSHTERRARNRDTLTQQNIRDNRWLANYKARARPGQPVPSNPNVSMDAQNRARSFQQKLDEATAKEQGLASWSSAQAVIDARTSKMSDGKRKALREKMHDWFVQHQSKYPTRDEIIAEIERQQVEIEIDWGFDKHLYELSPEEMDEAQELGRVPDPTQVQGGIPFREPPGQRPAKSSTEARVKVRLPDGRVGTIPSSNIEGFIRKYRKDPKAKILGIMR